MLLNQSNETSSVFPALKSTSQPTNNFDLSDAEDNTSGPLNRGGLADLPLLRTLLAIHQVPRAKFLGSKRLFCFISICKFGNFKNPFAKITSLSELYLRFRRFIPYK